MSTESDLRIRAVMFKSVMRSEKVKVSGMMQMWDDSDSVRYLFRRWKMQRREMDSDIPNSY